MLFQENRIAINELQHIFIQHITSWNILRDNISFSNFVTSLIQSEWHRNKAACRLSSLLSAAEASSHTGRHQRLQL